jgi:hypothetical protein
MTTPTNPLTWVALGVILGYSVGYLWWSFKETKRGLKVRYLVWAMVLLAVDLGVVLGLV